MYNEYLISLRVHKQCFQTEIQHREENFFLYIYRFSLFISYNGETGKRMYVYNIYTPKQEEKEKRATHKYGYSDDDDDDNNSNSK